MRIRVRKQLNPKSEWCRLQFSSAKTFHYEWDNISKYQMPMKSNPLDKDSEHWLKKTRDKLYGVKTEIEKLRRLESNQ